MNAFEPMSAAEYQQQVAEQMSEDVLQRRVLDLARVLGWLAYHTHDSRRSQPGFPDLVLVRDDVVLWRELKRQKGGRVSREQQIWVSALSAAGQDVAIWRPSDLLDGSIEHTLRGVES